MAKEKKLPQTAARERSLLSWDPFGVFNRWPDVERLFTLRPGAFHPFFSSLRQAAIGEWVPSVDVYKIDGTLVVKADLPGLTKDDIHVSVDEGDLIIEGERKEESEVKEEHCYRLERSTGSFFRRMPIGFEVAVDKIEANFKDGVLEIHIPEPVKKKPKAQMVPIK